MADSLKPTPLELKELRRKLATRLTFGLDRTVASLDVFYMRLETEWRERFELNWELYSFSEPLLLNENRLELEELYALLEIFTEWEDYEYCSIVKELYSHLIAEQSDPEGLMNF